MSRTTCSNGMRGKRKWQLDYEASDSYIWMWANCSDREVNKPEFCQCFSIAIL